MAYGFLMDTLPSNPVYTTGLTWLGVAITLGFAFFGVEGDDAPSVHDATKKISLDAKKSVDRLMGNTERSGGNIV